MARRGYSLQEIAHTLKRVKSAIWYETQKKRNGKRYDAAYAKHLSYARMRAKRKEGKKIALDQLLRRFVEYGLMDDQSPEAIEGRLKHVEINLKRTSAFAIRRFIKSPYGRRIEAHRLKVFKKKRRARPPKARMDGKRIDLSHINNYERMYALPAYVFSYGHRQSIEQPSSNEGGIRSL